MKLHATVAAACAHRRALLASALSKLPAFVTERAIFNYAGKAWGMHARTFLAPWRAGSILKAPTSCSDLLQLVLGRTGDI
eukprot:6178962-Pleurochrysis_carterae.AAC.1